MNDENLNKMENGMTLIRQYDKTVIKDNDKIFKCFKYFIIMNTVWLVCISGFCVYIYHRVENQPCTCLQQLPGEDVKVDGEGIPLPLQNDGNTPQDEQRRQRRHVSKDGQVVQAREKDEIKRVDAKHIRDESDIMLRDDSSSSHKRKEVEKVRKSACQCSEEQLKDVVRKMVTEMIEPKIRHRRGSRSRPKQRKSKKSRSRRTTTPLEPRATEQSHTNSTNGSTNANVQPAQIEPAPAPAPTPTPTHAPRFPLFHMTGREVVSDDPLQTLNSKNMYKSWDVDQTISDHSIARMADGTVTIKKTGIYLVYAQIVFYNSIVYNGVAIKVNGEEKSRCFQHGPANPNTPTDGTRPTPPPPPTPFHNAVFSTCNPLQPMYLQEYDNLTFVSLQNDSWTYFNPLTSYWGLIMLSDALPPTPAPTQ